MNTLVRIVSLRFPPDLCDKLDQLARADGRTRHAYIMRALQAHVDRAMNNLEHVVGPTARAERQKSTILEFPVE